MEKSNNQVLLCPICETSFALSSISYFPGYSVLTCPHCQTRFSQPFVDNEDVYTDTLIQEKSEYFETTNFSYSDLFPSLQNYVKIKNKKVLDIGCGTGKFLEIMKKDNEVLGLEVSPAYKTFLKQKGIPHQIGDLEELLASLPDSYYDLITFWDVFEHLKKPSNILSLAKRKLISNGIIINWTNNYDDYISYFSELTYRLSFGKYYSLMAQSFNRAGGHNFNFIPGSLEKLYEKLGFQIIETVITDTPSDRLTKSIIFKIILEIFYFANKVTNKGKIICHVLKQKG